MEKKEFSPGNIVKSLKGHDTGKNYLIIGLAGGGFVLIADGSSRTKEKPKLKRASHLRFLSQGVAGAENPEDLNNAAIINILRKFEGGFYA